MYQESLDFLTTIYKKGRSGRIYINMINMINRGEQGELYIC